MAPPPQTKFSPPSAAALEESRRREGLMHRLAQRTRASAEIVFPAVPSLADHYTDILADHFAALGRPFSGAEIDSLRRTILEKANEGFQKSPYSNVFVRYSTTSDGSHRIEYGVAVATSSLAEEYEHWVKTREPPLFGANPDARVLAALRDLGVPATGRCLDIGAGTGRNTLPIARLGHPVDALEASPALADVLEKAANDESLAVTVTRANVLTDDAAIGAGRYAFALASQVSSHFRGPADLRALCAAFARALAPGGHALFTAFITQHTYKPDRIARELSQVFWSTFFTPADLTAAIDGLPLRVVSDEDALQFERAHQPADAWPPTGWYEGWALGRDLFGGQNSPPIALRWVLLQRTTAAK